MNVLKKIFSVSVTFTTVLWSLGVSALVPAVAVAASCPVLNPGDEIKVVGQAPIYLLNNNKEVMAYYSGYDYKTSRPTYGGYISITDECYTTLKAAAAQPIFVNAHPGTDVLQRESSAQWYVVEPGNTIAKITQAAAKDLYGTYVKPRIVSNAQFGSYIKTGADISESKVHAGMLVKNGGKTWYVGNDMKLWEVTLNGMTANKFQSKYAYAVSDSAIAGLAIGGMLDAEDKTVTDKTQSGGIVSTPESVAVPAPVAVVSGSLNVSLASDNPFATTIVSDSGTDVGAQAQVKVLRLNFTAGSDGDAVVTKVALTRGGISADTDISNMYLFDGNTQIASNPSVLNNKVTFSNTGGLFTVAKGSSKSIEVRLDLKNGVSAGKTLSFSVASASEVATSGNASVGGTYPLAGNSFTTAAVSDLGKLVFANVSPTAAGTVDPGTNGFEIWKFKATNTNQDMEVRKLKFTIVGSVNVGDLKNFSLWDGGNMVGSVVADMDSAKTVTFDWSAAPYLVTKGQTKNLSLKADVVAGTNRTLYASFQNQSDIVIYDKNYNVYVKPNGTDTFTIVQAGGATSVNWSINVGSLTQTVAADAPTGNIADAATSITLAKFLWKANGEDVKVSSLSVSSTGSDITDKLVNVRLLVNGSQVGSTISSLTANGASNSGWGSFGNSFIVKAGKQVEATVVADTTDATVLANATFIVGLAAGSSNAQGTVSLTNISSLGKDGNTLTVKSGTVTVTKSTAFGERSSTNPTGTVNGSNQKVGSFIITAGAGEDVTISQITIRDAGTTYCAGTYLQNLTLKDASGKQLGITYANPSATCTSKNSYTFNLSPAVRVANGGQYQVDVFADLKASFTVASTALVEVNSVSAQGVSTGSDASANSQALALQTAYISASGAFMVQTDPDTSEATNSVMGATNANIGKFKVTASSTEAINITQLVVSTIFSSGATGTMSNIRLIDQATGLQVGSAVANFSDTVAGTSSPTSTYSHATFSNLNFNVPAGTSKVLVVRVDFSTYLGGGFTTTGQTIAPVILSNYYTNGSTNPVTATGASSGTSVTASISRDGTISAFTDIAPGAYGSTTTLYRAKLTTEWATDAPSGLSSPGAAQTVAKFKVSNLANSGNYDATVKVINFNFSTTISAGLGVNATRALTVYKDSLNTTALATTNFVASQKFDGTTGGGTADTATRIAAASFTDVVIAANSSKTFLVTLDTTDAASAKSLSVRIPVGTANSNLGFQWTDDVSATITDMDGQLPLVYKTLTY